MSVPSGASGFAHSSRGRLTSRDAGRFPGESLFDRLARQVCQAGCLPRKELFEAWETARRVRRRCRGGRIVDLGGGHGLVAQVMLLLDDSSPEALVVDRVLPASHTRVHRALCDTWPRLTDRVTFREGNLSQIELRSTDVVVSIHACGALSDLVLHRAQEAHARVAVLPCCHDLSVGDRGSLDGWMDGPLAIDVVRAQRLRAAGYRIWTQTVPAAITPKNRLLIAVPEQCPQEVSDRQR
jgi:hypothetical protein